MFFRILKKIVIYLMVIILLIIAGGAVYLYYNINPFIEKQINSAFHKFTNNQFQLSYQKFELNLKDGYLLIDSIQITPKKSGIQPPVDVSRLSIEQLNITNINLREMYTSRTLDIGYIEFRKPKIHLQKKDISSFQFQKKKHKKGIGLIKAFKLKELQLKNGSIDYKSGKSIIAQTNSFQLIASEIMLPDKKLLKEKSTNFSIGDIRFHVNDIIYNLPDQLNQLVCEKISYAKQDSTLRISEFKYLPKYNKYTYAKKVGYQKDRLYIELSDCNLSQVNFESLITKDQLISDSCTIKGLKIYTFKDRRLPAKKRYVKFPLQMLKEAKFPIYIGHLSGQNAFISYEEQPPGEIPPSKIFFKQLKFQLNNLTNIPEYISQKKKTFLSANCQFMGVSYLSLRGDFDLLSKHQTHSIKGKLGYINLLRVNSILENLAFLRIQKGILRKMDFEFSANNYSSNGTLAMYYTDLKVAILHKNEEEHKSEYKKTKSFIANRIIKSNNPSGKKPLRIGTITQSRDESKSMFSFWGKSILSGVKTSLGPEKLAQKQTTSKRKKTKRKSKPLFKKKH